MKSSRQPRLARVQARRMFGGFVCESVAESRRRRTGAAGRHRRPADSRHAAASSCTSTRWRPMTADGLRGALGCDGSRAGHLATENCTTVVPNAAACGRTTRWDEMPRRPSRARRTLPSSHARAPLLQHAARRQRVSVIRTGRRAITAEPRDGQIDVPLKSSPLAVRDARAGAISEGCANAPVGGYNHVLVAAAAKIRHVARAGRSFSGPVPYAHTNPSSPMSWLILKFRNRRQHLRATDPPALC